MVTQALHVGGTDYISSASAEAPYQIKVWSAKHASSDSCEGRAPRGNRTLAYCSSLIQLGIVLLLCLLLQYHLPLPHLPAAFYGSDYDSIFRAFHVNTTSTSPPFVSQTSPPTPTATRGCSANVATQTMESVETCSAFNHLCMKKGGLEL